MFLAAPDCIDLLIRIMTSGNNISLNYFFTDGSFRFTDQNGCCTGHSDLFSLHRQKYLGICPAGTSRQRTPFHQVHCLVFLHIIHLWRTVLRLFILPLLINFGLSFATPNIRAVFGVSGIISTALWLSVVFGLMFQFPLITRSLIRSGIVSYRSVTGKRPHVIVGILLLAALLTPPDIVSQLMLAVPTYALFETSLFFSRPKQK